MFAARFSPAIVALALVCAGGATCHAQYDNSHADPSWSDPDYQFFEPVNLDLDGLMPQKDCGVTFRYDRLTWAIPGERTTIGKAGLTVQAEEMQRQNDMDEGTIPPTYTVINGIQNAPPWTEFGSGDRYEIGYFEGDKAWHVGVLDGPDVHTHNVYGADTLQVPNTLPLITQTDLRRDNNPVTDPNFADDFDYTQTLITIPGGLNVGSADIPLSANGFGSVHVNFETPPGFLLGWRDYWAGGGPTVQGPGLVVTAIEIEDNLITDITVSEGVDGLIDNIDGDDIPGIVIITDDDDNVIGIMADYDDLHEFNVRFETLITSNVTQTSGVEIMRTHTLSNRHKMAQHQNHHLEIGYGVRFFRLRDVFVFDGRGDWIGRSWAHTKVDNQIVGPQLRGKWAQQHGRWGLNVDGRFVFGYNIQDFGQEGIMGETLVPGGLNSPLFFQPTAFAYGKQENHFSPMAELRVESTYQLTSSITFRAGYSATFVDNLTRASSSVNYRLPDMGFVDESGEQTIFMNGVDLGFEVVY